MLATLCGLVFLSRRNLPSLVVLSLVVMLTMLLVISEQLVVTPREEVEASLAELLEAVASNDVARVLSRIDPAAANLRSDAETLMPLVDVVDTGATAVSVVVDQESTPWTATAHCKARLRGVHRQTGATVFYFDQVDFVWVRQGDRWLLQDYTAMMDGRPLDAVKSLRSNRPAPVYSGD